MSNDKRRSEFEAWARTCDGNCSQHDLRRCPDDSYAEPSVDRDFQVWQASLEYKPEVSQPVAYNIPRGKNFIVTPASYFEESGFDIPEDATPLFSSPPDYEALKAENEELKEDLQFVERWANHHGVKSCHTAEEVLSCIQHYPAITAITKSYEDGVMRLTREIDVIISGEEGAAKQASLCDLVEPIRDLVNERNRLAAQHEGEKK